MVHCSPGIPLNLRCGLTINWIPASSTRLARACQSSSGRASPKCGTGTSSPGVQGSGFSVAQARRRLSTGRGIRVQGLGRRRLSTGRAQSAHNRVRHACLRQTVPHTRGRSHSSPPFPCLPFFPVHFNPSLSFGGRMSKWGSSNFERVEGIGGCWQSWHQPSTGLK